MSVLSLVSDLMFGSKVAATARAHGLEVRGARSVAGMREATGSPRLVVVDLEAEVPDGDPLDVVRDARRRIPRPRVVAFAGHLLVDRLDAARQAGADLVMTRGAFAARLESLMESLAAEARSGSSEQA